MADLTVNTGDLEQLRIRLQESADGLGRMLGSMGDGSVALGTDELNQACGEFHESWTYGLGKVVECVGKVRDGVDATKNTYAQAEQGIHDGFGKMNSAIGGAQ